MERCIPHDGWLVVTRRVEIESLWRARTLRPLAEAYQSMGDGAMALALYKRVVADGAENPNARPRAEDLIATCCSMAVHGIQPDETLRARILEIERGLAPPW